MAIVCLVVVLVALAAGALISREFWEVNVAEPRLGIGPGPRLESAIGEASPVGPGERLAVAPAQRAPGIASGVAAKRVSVPVSEGAPPRAAVGQAQAVRPAQPPAPASTQHGSSTGGTQPQPAPEAVPVATPVTPPASPPQAAPTQPGRPATGGEPGPIGAGAGTGVVAGPVRVEEGDELVYSFSFRAAPSAYREPGEEDSILRFAGGAGEAPTFGLQLWDDGGGQRGLWSSGDAMGGERLLAPLADDGWHRLAVDFKASGEGEGFYLVLLDGEPVDARAFVSLIASGQTSALVEAGLLRDGERVVESADVLFGPVELGGTLESVLP